MRMGDRLGAWMLVLVPLAGYTAGDGIAVAGVDPDTRVRQGGVAFEAAVTVGLLIGLLLLIAALLLSLRRRHAFKLRESGEMYRALVKGLPDSILRFDRKGRILSVSDKEFDSGVCRTEAAGLKTHGQMGFSAEQCRFWEEGVRAVVASRTICEMEHAPGDGDGPVVVNWRFIPECDARGAVQTILAIGRDITEHRKTERNYQMLFQEMLEGFAVHEIIGDGQGKPVDYRFLAVNPAFERMMGLNAKALVGRTIREIMPNAEQRWIEIYGNVALTGEPAFFENESAVQKKVFEVTVFRPVPGQFACIYSDVTRRKSVEEQVRKLLAEGDRARRVLLGIIEDETRAKADYKRLVMAIEQAAEIIMVTDGRGVMQYVNPAFESVTGYTREEAVGQTLRILKSGQQDADFYRRMWETILSGKVWQGRFVNRKKSGELYTEEATISPVRDAAGAVTNYVAVKRDITAELRMELQLAHATKMESVGRLAGGVAHDFNNLIMGIMGYAELCRDSLPANTPARCYLDEIVGGAKRSADLTRQLLAFARKQTIAPRVLDLNDAMAGMLKLLRRLIGEGIELVWKPGANLWPVRLDPSQIDQILANLCVNARDAIGGTGTVIIETANVSIAPPNATEHPGMHTGDYVLLIASDNGCGMKKEVLEHIFEPFFTTKGIGEGTGLGLATVYGIVRQNNGYIYVYSEPGKGTTFKIYLPRFAGGVAEIAVGSALSVPRGHGETVMLVEDEEMLRAICSEFLKGLGYTVVVAENPAAALDRVASYPGVIHLLLTDMIMPGMNGRQLADKIRAMKPSISVLFMSGYTVDMIDHQGVLKEDVPFLGKPFSRDDLARKIREVLDKPGRGAA